MAQVFPFNGDLIKWAKRTKLFVHAKWGVANHFQKEKGSEF